MITKHKLKIGIGVVVGATALTLLLGGGGDFNSKMSSQVKGKYSIAGEKLTMIAKSDPKDRVVVEVGDTVFKPKVKISRWDEVDFSLTLKDNEVGTETVSSKDDKIVWSKGNIETNFYDLPISASNSEGGFETEVILKSKPKTNKIEFTLETQGLDFFYQPALTQAEIDEGASRPENVVGSYAVYAKTPKTNWTGGKEYKVGKVGHIFRPKIIDSTGTEVWGDLHIENGILSVTIPQDFLDKAVYPVRHAAGLRFGYEGEGGSVVAQEDGLYLFGSVFTSPTGSNVVNSLSVWTQSEDANIYVKGVVVLHSNLNIITNGVGAASTAVAVEDPSWSVSSFSTTPTLSASTDYVLMIISSNLNYIYYDSGDANQGHNDTSNSYTTPTNPTDATHNTNKYSIYATYESAAPPVGAPIIDDMIIITE